MNKTSAHGARGDTAFMRRTSIAVSAEQAGLVARATKADAPHGVDGPSDAPLGAGIGCGRHGNNADDESQCDHGPQEPAIGAEREDGTCHILESLFWRFATARRQRLIRETIRP